MGADEQGGCRDRSFTKLNRISSQILHLLAGDTVDLWTEYNSDAVFDIILCLYMAPAPYGL